ncbi:MAG TPA: DUF6573 family protein [Candidatus Binatia bacterium]|nr:DUF6573 family protein [Candidatus Binatia bacterium]
MKEFGEVIFSYSRKQAIEDGVLVDVSDWASPREMMGGFTIPVAMTAAVWALVEAPEKSHEDTRGRAHDVLWMAQLAARRNLDTDRTAFTVLINGKEADLVLHVGPGDDGEPVATIMLPGED